MSTIFLEHQLTFLCHPCLFRSQTYQGMVCPLQLLSLLVQAVSSAEGVTVGMVGWGRVVCGGGESNAMGSSSFGQLA
jgi:hypothetical protein